MLQSVHEGIIAVDQDSRITLVNKAALRLLQKAGLGESPIGKKMDAYMSASRLSRVLQTGQAELDEEQHLNGVALLVNRVPVFVDNNIVGAVATFRDKTEISRLAEQLTKTLYDNMDALVAVNVAAKGITRENAEKTDPVPLHPGAARFYQGR